MGLSIVALFVYIFGAYAYGHLLFLWGRHRSFASRGAFADNDRRTEGAGLRLFALCAVWFVLLAIIEFRALLGDPRENDWLDLTTLAIAFAFPGVIFHSYFYATSSRLSAGGDMGPDLSAATDTDGGDSGGAVSRHARRWALVLWALYAAGLGLGLYTFAAIFNLAPRLQPFNQWIGIFIGSQFTIMSICAMLMSRSYPRRDPTVAQRRLGSAINRLFVVMIIVFIAMVLLPNEGLALVGRATPLMFLVVSVYYENRIEFYDLVIKRGVLLLVSLILTGAVLATTLGSVSSLPDGPARPWIFAVLLLPVAMVMPWLHDRIGRLLDQWWFGRDFTPVEAVKHVLAAMQQAADEPALIASAETTLSEMFHRRITILGEGERVPEHAGVVIEVGTVSPDRNVRVAVIHEPGTRAMLSEDVALLRSLAGVLGYLLENVRLQRRRQEHEQVAQQLRLQTSRSELKALRAQINPHFLFNALNAIASLIHTDPARADAAVEQLAEVFRYTLRRSEQEWAPLDQELAFARAYLDVEQARFGKRLHYEIHADDGVAHAHVPSMLLQTLVENAVKHGISRLRTPGRIDVIASRGDRRVTLEVRDTGPGPASTDAVTPGEHFGLRSVRDRLLGHFGADASLELRRVGDITIARIEMPLIEELSPAGVTR
jgi:signal transduction histidine kinase